MVRKGALRSLIGPGVSEEPKKDLSLEEGLIRILAPHKKSKSSQTYTGDRG